MQPIDRSRKLSDVVIPCTTTLEALIPVVSSADCPVPVIDQAGNVVGACDQNIVLMALAES